jgi:GlpG protein
VAKWRKRTWDAGAPVNWSRVKQAPFTALVSVSSALVSIGYMNASPQTWEELANWGVLPGAEIWHGRIWPLWTTALLHGDPLHLLFNLYWFWFFGSHLEPHFGRLKFLGLSVVGTFVSSCAELTVNDNPGIGLSGLVYALFGYAWLAPRESEQLASLMSKRTVVWMIGWLFLCLALTWTNTYNVGNAAHFTGIALGAALGLGRTRYPRLGVAVAMVLVLASAASLTWSPWSTQWLSSRAFSAIEAGKPDVAASYIEKVLRIDPTNTWALERKRELELQAIPKPRLDALLRDANAGSSTVSQADLAAEMLKFGSIQVHLDPSRAGVIVPENFAKQSTLMLEVGHDMVTPIPDLAVTASGISGTLSFDGQPFRCSVPWTAVTALTLDKKHSIAWDLGPAPQE